MSQILPRLMIDSNSQWEECQRFWGPYIKIALLNSLTTNYYIPPAYRVAQLPYIHIHTPQSHSIKASSDLEISSFHLWTKIFIVFTFSR